MSNRPVRTNERFDVNVSSPIADTIEAETHCNDGALSFVQVMSGSHPGNFPQQPQKRGIGQDFRSSVKVSGRPYHFTEFVNKYGNTPSDFSRGRTGFKPFATTTAYSGGLYQPTKPLAKTGPSIVLDNLTAEVGGGTVSFCVDVVHGHGCFLGGGWAVSTVPWTAEAVAGTTFIKGDVSPQPMSLGNMSFPSGKVRAPTDSWNRLGEVVAMNGKVSYANLDYPLRPRRLDEDKDSPVTWAPYRLLQDSTPPQYGRRGDRVTRKQAPKLVIEPENTFRETPAANAPTMSRAKALFQATENLANTTQAAALTLTNADSSTVVFSTDASLLPEQSTISKIGTKVVTSAATATIQVMSTSVPGKTVTQSSKALINFYPETTHTRAAWGYSALALNGKAFTLTDTAGTSQVFVFSDAVTTTTNGTIGIKGTQATATWKFSDKPNEGSTITLTDFYNVSKTFEVDNENNGVRDGNIALNGIAAAGGGGNGTAADLAAKINAQNTANGFSFTAAVSTNQITITSVKGSAQANTAITTNDNSHWTAMTDGAYPMVFAMANGLDLTVQQIATKLKDTVNDGTVSALVTASTPGHLGGGVYSVEVSTDNPGHPAKELVPPVLSQDERNRLIVMTPFFGGESTAFTLRGLSTSKTFVFDGSSTAHTNGTIGLQADSTSAHVAKAIVDSINDASVSSLGITASPSVPTADANGNYTITLTQGAVGHRGNTEIVSPLKTFFDSNYRRVPASFSGIRYSKKFSGGVSGTVAGLTRGIYLSMDAAIKAGVLKASISDYTEGVSNSLRLTQNASGMFGNSPVVNAVPQKILINKDTPRSRSSFYGGHNGKASFDVAFSGQPSVKALTPAYSTFTFSDKPNEGSTITLTDIDGVSVTFEVDNEANGAAGSNVALDGIAAAGGGAAGTATDLINKINAQSFKITATSGGTGAVNLVQDEAGDGSGAALNTWGNTPIVTNDAAHWNSSCSVNVPSRFGGGVNLSGGQSIRLQSTDGKSLEYRAMHGAGNNGVVQRDGSVGFDVGTSVSATMANLKTSVDGANGHGPSRLVSSLISGSRSAARIVFTDKPNEYSWIQLNDGSRSVRFEVDNEADGPNAVATFTLTDKPNEGSTITLTDSDGTAVVFEIDNEANGVSGSNVAVDGIAAAGGGAVGTAVDLAAKINAQGALDITATVPSSGQVVLYQNTGGAAGDKAISLNDSAHWNSVCSVNVPASFSGGTANVALNGIAAAGGGATGTAADLAAKINASPLEITATTPSAGEILIVHDVGATVGNTSILVHDAAHWEANTSLPLSFTGLAFEGGTNALSSSIRFTQTVTGNSGNRAVANTLSNTSSPTFFMGGSRGGLYPGLFKFYAVAFTHCGRIRSNQLSITVEIQDDIWTKGVN